MNGANKLDPTKPLGFASASDRLSNGVDFQDDTLGAKLGAKVGAVENQAEIRNRTTKTNKLDYAKLLGFEGVGEQLSESVDFQDETMNAKLGAKDGVESML